VFKIEENQSNYHMLLGESSTDSEASMLGDSPIDLNKKGARDCPGVNVSPSSVVEKKQKTNDLLDDVGSLNSSRMTGTQELSIHEGM
jgi:hypothetical protein